MSPESDRSRSLNRRLANAARESTTDIQRLRRKLAFHRFLARIAYDGWVLKGGYCLEARLEGQARATKDIDFVRASSAAGDDLLDELDGLFALATVDDGFSFQALAARQLRAIEDPSPAWRLSVDCAVDGRRFDRLTVDVVAQFEEIAEAVEPLVIPSPVPGAGFGPVTVDAVDVYQHAAEKLHAMSRVYAHDLPSSRVKDLVDLALLIEAGLLLDHRALRRRLTVVHHHRDNAIPPADLPAPPKAWSTGYLRLIEDLDLRLATADDAFESVRSLYRSALSEDAKTSRS